MFEAPCVRIDVGVEDACHGRCLGGDLSVRGGAGRGREKDASVETSINQTPERFKEGGGPFTL
jgi:hypothetical protein